MKKNNGIIGLGFGSYHKAFTFLPLLLLERMGVKKKGHYSGLPRLCFTREIHKIPSCSSLLL
jgi:hypothetical protein